MKEYNIDSVNDFKNLENSDSEKYKQIRWEIANVVKDNFVDYFSQRSRVAALEWIHKFNQTIFSGVFQWDQILSKIDYKWGMDISPDMSLSRKFDFNGVDMNMSFWADGNIRMTNFVNNNQWEYSVWVDQDESNDLFQWMSLKELLDSTSLSLDLSNLDPKKSFQDAINDSIMDQINDKLASRSLEYKNAKKEMAWELKRQVLSKSMLDIYRPPMAGYVEGNMSVTDSSSGDFYDFLKTIDQWTSKMTSQSWF